MHIHSDVKADNVKNSASVYCVVSVIRHSPQSSELSDLSNHSESGTIKSSTHGQQTASSLTHLSSRKPGSLADLPAITSQSRRGAARYVTLF